MSNAFWKLILIAGLAAALLLMIFANGYIRGRDGCRSDGAAQIAKEEKAYAEAQKQAMALPDSALDRQLCARWMRSSCGTRRLPSHISRATGSHLHEQGHKAANFDQ